MAQNFILSTQNNYKNLKKIFHSKCLKRVTALPYKGKGKR